MNRQGVSRRSDRFHSELKRQGAELASRYKLGPQFTPPVVSTGRGRSHLDAALDGGRANWRARIDPETKMIMFILRRDLALGLVQPKPGRSDMRFVRGTATARETRAEAPMRRRGRTQLPCRACRGETALWPHHGDQFNSGDRVWQWRMAKRLMRSEPSGTCAV